MKFRKKPVEVTAVKWYPGAQIPGVLSDVSDPDRAYIRTLEGTMNVRPGDWIITGIWGEKYPCHPEIFEATYEEVSE